MSRFEPREPEERDGPEEEQIDERDLADLPPGFEHYRFRTKPEIAEALRKMSLLPED